MQKTTIYRDDNKRKINKSYENKDCILENYPKILQLEHTTKCNLECIACSHYFSDKTHTQELDIAVIEKLSDIFPYIEQIQLNGGGEPFLHSKINDMLKIYMDYNLRITTTTNLTILNKTIIDSIKKCFTQLNLSCDGATEKTFSGIRKNSNFNSWITNVKKVRSLKDDLILVFGVTLMRQNIEELPQIVTLAHDLGINKIVVGRMIPRQKTLPHTTFDDIKNYINISMKYIFEARDIADKFKIPFVYPSLTSVVNDDFVKKEKEIMLSKPNFPGIDYQKKLKSLYGGMKSSFQYLDPQHEINTKASEDKCEGICDWLNEIVFVDCSGKVYTCCQKTHVSIGNLMEKIFFMDIWNNTSYQELRKCFYSGNIPMHCTNCQFITQNFLKHLKKLS